MTVPDVAEYIAENPGVHFNDLVASLEMTPQRLLQVSAQLEREKRINIADFYGKTHYYPPGYDHWEQGAIALLRRETSREILLYLLEHTPASPGAVADDVGIARSTLEWHLERLIDANLVTKTRDTWPHELRVENPEEIGTILTQLQPSAPERWVDRTVRLLDHLLESDRR